MLAAQSGWSDSGHYHPHGDPTEDKASGPVSDTEALNDHSNFHTDNIIFLLDASLGFIGLEQTAVMQMFSIIAGILVPPTLISGIYGMNFEHMPELKWLWGYPFGLGLILTLVTPTRIELVFSP